VEFSSLFHALNKLRQFFERRLYRLARLKQTLMQIFRVSQLL
jgi:hypothetical protein